MSKRGDQMRKDVLAALESRDQPLGAYDILEMLSAAYPKIAPPTVYRALSALVAGGKAHRLESLNAYVPCRDHAHGDAPVFSICDDCGAVEERSIPGLMHELASSLGGSGFAASRHVIEVHGTCGSCNAGSQHS